jgi:hypothetical protein
MRLDKNVETPFVVFFLMFGLGSLILVPIINLVIGLTKETNIFLDKLVWSIGALGSLLYSVIGLRKRFFGCLADKILYLFMALFFVILIFFPFLL